MAANDQQPKFWSTTQAYVMAVVCLILGIAFGYLFRGPGSATASVPSVTQPTMPGNKTAAMPNQADIKRMADKQVAPLLAELEKDPQNADLLAKIGLSYLTARQFQDAQRYLEQSVSLKPSPDALNALAFDYYSLGEVDRAIETLNRALKLDPKDPKTLYNLGMFEWHGKSDPKAAIAAWQAFLKAHPDDPKRPQVEKLIAQAGQHLNIAPGTKTAKPAAIE